MKKPKLLYICGHDILEYNHLKLFYGMGFDAISTSKYLFPDKEKEFPLPKLQVEYNKELAEEFASLNPVGYRYGKTKMILTKSFLQKFDVVVSSWIAEPIIEYIALLKDKPVFIETMGQSSAMREVMLSALRSRGVKVVRISEGEEYFPKYAGTDFFIDLEVDTDYFHGWVGSEPNVITVNTSFSKRVTDCRYREYREVIKGLPAKLYGRGNENIKEPFNCGEVSRDELLRQYQINRVGFASVSVPCPCTLTPKEMLSTGMPVVTYGPKICGPTFRAHQYIEEGNAGFYSDNLNELRDFIKSLLNNHNLSQSFSENARSVALKLFSEKAVSTKWAEAFKSVGVRL